MPGIRAARYTLRRPGAWTHTTASASTTGASCSTRTHAASQPCRLRRGEIGEPAERFDRSLKGVVVDVAGYDWEGDRPLGRSFRETVIYEAHVRGMTANPNSGVARASGARIAAS